MSLPFVSLNAATATGAGASRDLEGVYTRHTLAVSVTGGPESLQVRLEGSHDGINWHVLSGTFASTGFYTADSHLVRYVRANFISISGGSSPTVTATIASEVL